jgi:hypothetical protein
MYVSLIIMNRLYYLCVSRIRERVPRMATGGAGGYRDTVVGWLTLGAKLTILPHPFIRRSALTTPPIRVPNNSRLLLSNTAALSSKRTQRPSGLRTGFLLRTITARRTSPRRTLSTLEMACEPGDIGRARFTTQTISSPTVPQPLLTLFLSTLTHSTRSAPELSITYFLGGLVGGNLCDQTQTHV